MDVMSSERYGMKTLKYVMKKPHKERFALFKQN